MATLAQTSQPTYQLREYQQELFEKIFAQWDAGDRRLLCQLPTGAGKTVLFSAVSRQFTQRGEGVLVLAHREELLLQAKEKLESVTGLPAGLIKAGYPVNPEHLIQIASVQSLIRRHNWPKAELIICDEAHHSASNTYKTILEHYQQAFILGVSATPARPDGQGFKFLYDSLILGRTVKELIAANHLCDFRLFAAPKTIVTTNIKVTGGEFDRRELAERINTSLVMGDLIEAWQKFALTKKTVLFTIDVKHSKAIAEAYIDAGFPAEHLDGETPANERKAILERFRTGETLILCNCGIVSEGTDVPSIEAIQCVRPTRSLILWLQMVGRGLRPVPGKEHCLIIDHTENWVVHGLPNEEHQWSLEPFSLKSSKKHSMQCPECHHIFLCLPHERKPYRKDWDEGHREYKVYSKITCPNCATEFDHEYWEGGEPPPPRIINNDKAAAIEEINLECNPEIIAELHRLKKMQEKREYKPLWIYHRLVELHPEVGLSELQECAKLLGYKSGWAWHKWQELQQEQQKSA